MNLKDKSALERMIGRSWMYKTTTYRFNDFVQSNGHVIISTDVKALTVNAEDIFEFIKECLPADAPALVKSNINGFDTSIFKELSDGLMQSFRDIQAANQDEIKTIVTKAKSKIKIAGSVTNIAKVVLDAKRMSEK